MPIGNSIVPYVPIAAQLGSGRIRATYDSPTGALSSNPLVSGGGAAGGAAGSGADLGKYTLGEGDFAAGAGGAAPLKGILGMLAKRPFEGARFTNFAPVAADASTFGRVLAPGSIGRAGAYGIAGQLGSGILRSALGGEKDGNWDNFAEDALSYGGAGAGIGSMIAPGVGTAIGGAAGVGVAALKDFLFGGGADSDATEAAKVVHKQDAMLDTLLGSAGLSPEATRQIRLQLLTANQGVTDANQIQAAYASIRANIPAIAAQEQQQRQQLAGTLATQQMLAPQFDTFLRGIGADTKAFNAANSDYAQQLSAINPAFGGYLGKADARSVLSNDATAAAYKAQLNSQVAQQASQIGAPPSILQTLQQQYG